MHINLFMQWLSYNCVSSFNYILISCEVNFRPSTPNFYEVIILGGDIGVRKTQSVYLDIELRL
jgi:hypothetical protein